MKMCVGAVPGVQLKECDLWLREISFSVSSSSLVLLLDLESLRSEDEDRAGREGAGGGMERSEQHEGRGTIFKGHPTLNSLHHF